jgi:fungal STAND N-terminal Goodbye domain
MSDVKQDPDLEEMWLEAERECRKLIGFKDGEQPPKLTVEDVLNKLDESKTSDEADAHTKLGKAKEVLEKTLVCINSLGSIAAQGASIVSFNSQS